MYSNFPLQYKFEILKKQKQYVNDYELKRHDYYFIDSYIVFFAYSILGITVIYRFLTFIVLYQVG